MIFLFLEKRRHVSHVKQVTDFIVVDDVQNADLYDFSATFVTILSIHFLITVLIGRINDLEV